MKRSAVPQSAAARLENAFSLKMKDPDNPNGNPVIASEPSAAETKGGEESRTVKTDKESETRARD